MAHSTAVRVKTLEDIASLVTNTGMPAKSAIREVAARTGVPAGTISRWYWPVTGAMNARRGKAKPKGSGPSVTPYDLINQQLDQGRSPEDIMAAFLAELERQSKERGHQLATTPETVGEVATNTTSAQENNMTLDDMDAALAQLSQQDDKEWTPDEIRAMDAPARWTAALNGLRKALFVTGTVRTEGLTLERAAYDLAQLAKEVSERGLRAAL